MPEIPPPVSGRRLPASFSSRDLRRILKHEDHPALREATPAQVLAAIVREMRSDGYVFTADREERA